MPFYTFHPRRADGAPLPSLRAELSDDLAAATYARGLLAGLVSAQAISVSDGGDRQVARVGSNFAMADEEHLRSSRKLIETSLELLRRTEPV